MDFTDMLQAHQQNGADISIATIPVNDRDAPEFGIMKTNEESLITSFIEKPSKDVLADWISDTGADMQKKGKLYLASMGIYIFNKTVLNELLKDKHPAATDFGKEIIPNSIIDYKVSSYQYNGYWTDIGNIYSFFEANLELTADIPLFNLFDNTNAIFTRARMLPPAKISGTTLEQTLIAEGSIIHASRLDKCVVGIRARIGHGTTVNNSYIMGNDYYETLEQMAEHRKNNSPLMGIGERCFIKDAIIDKNCRIGNDVRIQGGKHLANVDHELYTAKEGIVVVKKGAVLPDGFTI